MPPRARWLMAIPDAIEQLEGLDRDLLTRRDLEQLFGVSTPRASQLMRKFGAELVGYSRVLRRTDLLRQLRRYTQRAAFRAEERRVGRVAVELRKARLRGIRVAVPVESVEAASLSGLPEGVVVRADRIEVRFGSAREAVARLFALAQALTKDYERFETLVKERKPAAG